MNHEKWAKIKEIFHAALELPETEREKFIENSCGADETLLAEIQTLFEAHDQAEEFIETPALAPIADLVEETANFSRVGQIIGAYRIEREIGRGGMGAVYLANRADSEFEKKVAVKLIKCGLDTDEIIKRFSYERQILATLEHLFITRLIDGSATDDGLPLLLYLAFIQLSPAPISTVKGTSNSTADSIACLIICVALSTSASGASKSSSS